MKTCCYVMRFIFTLCGLAIIPISGYADPQLRIDLSTTRAYQGEAFFDDSPSIHGQLSIPISEFSVVGAQTTFGDINNWPNSVGELGVFASHQYRWSDFQAITFSGYYHQYITDNFSKDLEWSRVNINVEISPNFQISAGSRYNQYNRDAFSSYLDASTLMAFYFDTELQLSGGIQLARSALNTNTAFVEAALIKTYRSGCYLRGQLSHRQVLDRDRLTKARDDSNISLSIGYLF